MRHVSERHSIPLRLLPVAVTALAVTVALGAQAPQGALPQPPPAGRASGPSAPEGPRLKALLVSGGCCHDYALQDKVLVDQMAKVLPIDWTIVIQGGNGTKARIPLYDRADWAKGFDVVVHNECHADVDDEAFVKRITDAHRAGIPAMVIHCAMHCTARSRPTRGASSSASRASATPARTTSPSRWRRAATTITTGLQPEWNTPTDELYVIDKVWPGTTALATAVSPEADMPNIRWRMDARVRRRARVRHDSRARQRDVGRPGVPADADAGLQMGGEEGIAHDNPRRG